MGAVTGRTGAVVLGAEIGASIAASVGTLAGGRAAHSSVIEYEKDQADLREVQESLQSKKKMIRLMLRAVHAISV